MRYRPHISLLFTSRVHSVSLCVLRRVRDQVWHGAVSTQLQSGPVAQLHLVGLVVRVSESRAADQGFDSRGEFSG